MVESKAGSSLLGARSWGSQAEQWLRTQVPAHLGRGVSPSWSSTLPTARGWETPSRAPIAQMGDGDPERTRLKVKQPMSCQGSHTYTRC